MPNTSLRLYVRSFSFRIWVVIFCLLCALLVAQHILIYMQTIQTAYDDTRLIVEAHEEEMDTLMAREGIDDVRDLLQTISDATRDKRLYLLLRQGDELIGNLPAWPSFEFHGDFITEVMVPNPKAGEPMLHLLVSVADYHNGVHLLIGYSLDRVDDLRHDLIASLLENIALALLVSAAASSVIVWLLSCYMRRFNLACAQVMSGNLTHRIPSHHANDAFDALAENINRMLDWNNTLLATVRESGNAIAHDMRTPLSRLRLEMATLAKRPDLSSESRALVQEHVEKVDGLVDMFENILNIARAESRLNTSLFEPVDVAALVRDVLDFYEPILEQRALTLTTHIPEGDALLTGDKQLLGQAIMNLVDNACKYTPEGGRIMVAVEKAGQQIRVVVADSGEGVTPDLRDKVKERFFRMDASRHTSGHGLGLSLVNAVAALHHGELLLEDNAPGLKATLVLKAGV